MLGPRQTAIIPHMFKRVVNGLRPYSGGLRWLSYGLCLAALAALGVGVYQAYLQYQESRSLADIANTLKTGDPAQDIKAVVNYVYAHAYLGEGKYGLLRATATQVMDITIGGQCGEFVRLTINLLSQMGYTAHRLYMFPDAETGKAFDPATQPSFHVVAEVWIDRHWVLVDPLHGLVFHDSQGNLVTLDQVVGDPSIIKAGYKERPREIHPYAFGGTFDSPYYISGQTFANPQGLNWGQKPFIWIYKLVERVGPTDLSQIYLPVLAEQPYAIQALFCLMVALGCAGLSALSFAVSRRATRSGVTAPQPGDAVPASLRTA